MTERELMSLVYIQARIARITERIAELEEENGLGSVNMDGMPHGTTPGNPVERMALARAALHEKLLHLKADLAEKELAIVEYIESVEQEDVKLIMELRYIDAKYWQDIAIEWEARTGKYADRTTLAKKVEKYLLEHPN
jgi:hypothetical protein